VKAINATISILLCIQIAGCGDGLTPNEGRVNQPPSVDGGPQQYVQSGQAVTLLGTVVDDGISGIKWVQTAGTLVRLNSDNKREANFIAPELDASEDLSFEIIVNDGSNPAVKDAVVVTVHPAIGADTVFHWNRLGLSLVKKSERGPTISSRAMAYLNTALYSSWAAFDEDARGWISNKDALEAFDAGNQRATLQNFTMAATAHKVFMELTSGDSTILRQKHLEMGTNEDAEVFRAALVGDADAMLSDAADYAAARLDPILADQQISMAKKLSAEIAEEIIAFSLVDGAQALNDYSDSSARYSPLPWAAPAPTREQRNKINFYNETEYVDSEGVFFPEYEFPDYDPRVAARAVGATWDTEGKLLITEPKNMTINPAVLSGEVKLSENWQSLTEWGIFPPADDGGTQIPLTSHWGEVKPFSLATGASLRPEAIEGPYKSDGTLNTSFIEEVEQVITFAEKMKDRSEGGALQRAQSEYWELGDATAYPPGWWLETSVDLVEAQGLDLEPALKILFSVSQAVFDSGIAAWDTKYYFNSVRPYTAANQIFLGSIIPSFRGNVVAGTDDRNVWFPYQLRRNFTPPFPDIPSGHSAFSYAASTVLKELLRTNAFGLASEPFMSRFDLSDGFDGDPENGNEEIVLSWSLMSIAAEEAGLSRLYGGIHLMEGNWLGLKFGIQIGHATLNKVNALFEESASLDIEDPAQWLATIPKLTFGTMKSDVLQIETVEDQKIEVYGFYENDTLSVSAQSSGGEIELFAGDGLDSFEIAGAAQIRIRDYQSGEAIKIGMGPWGSLTLDQLSTSSVDGVTKLMAGDQTVLTLDGNWAVDSLNIQLL